MWAWLTEGDRPACHSTVCSSDLIISVFVQISSRATDVALISWAPRLYLCVIIRVLHLSLTPPLKPDVFMGHFQYPQSYLSMQDSTRTHWNNDYMVRKRMFNDKQSYRFFSITLSHTHTEPHTQGKDYCYYANGAGGLNRTTESKEHERSLIEQSLCILTLGSHCIWQ